MVFSLRPRAAMMIQRIASACRRSMTHFDRHLIGGAADPARAHFDRRAHIFERLVEHLQRVLLGFRLDPVERAIDDLSATDFLPACIRLFMNFEMMRSPNLGSGLISRFSAR